MVEYGTEFFNPRSAKLINMIEKPQRFYTRIALRRCGLRYEAYENRLQRFNLEPLDIRRKKLELITLFKIIHSCYDIDVQVLPAMRERPSRNHRQRLEQLRFADWNPLSNWFINRIIPVWNKLPKQLDEVATVAQFRNFVNKLPGSFLRSRFEDC